MLAPYRFSKALIVEDDDQLRRSVERLFANWNIPTITARTIGEARALLGAKPDLVIMDVRLPDGTGLMVAEAASALSPAPMMIAMSGVASANEAFELAQHGVHIYLSKPFSASQLAHKIEDALRSSGEPGTRHGPHERIPMAANVHDFARRYHLTPRQTTLVQLAISSTPRRNYPDVLGVTENTCKTMIRRLLHKCDARSLADIPRMMLVQGHEMGP